MKELGTSGLDGSASENYCCPLDQWPQVYVGWQFPLHKRTPEGLAYRGGGWGIGSRGRSPRVLVHQALMCSVSSPQGNWVVIFIYI